MKQVNFIFLMFILLISTNLRASDNLHDKKLYKEAKEADTTEMYSKYLDNCIKCSDSFMVKLKLSQIKVKEKNAEKDRIRMAKKAAKEKLKKEKEKKRVKKIKAMTEVNTNTKIRGAFGIEFGQIFHPSKALNKKKEKTRFTEAEIRLEFKPKKINSFFKKYYLYVTPVSYKVYKIRAVSDIYDCRKDKEIVYEMLANKYGKAIEEPATNAIGDVISAVSINEEEATIGLDCSKYESVFFKKRLFITYLDYKYSELNSIEKVEFEEAKIKEKKKKEKARKAKLKEKIKKMDASDF